MQQCTEPFLNFRRAGADVTHQFQSFAFRTEFLQSVSVVVNAHEEPCNGNVQNLGNLPQAAGGNPIRPAFVFLELLKGQAQLFGERRLAQTAQDASNTDTSSNMYIDGVGTLFAWSFCFLVLRHCSEIPLIDAILGATRPNYLSFERDITRNVLGLYTIQFIINTIIKAQG